MFIGISVNPQAEVASIQPLQNFHELEQGWKSADQGKIAELEKLGYDKHDIYHAIKISKIAKQDPEIVLTFYKKNRSWKETAKHFGVDPNEIKHHRHWKKHKEYLEKNKDKVMLNLASYLNKEETELNLHLKEGVSLHTLVKASVLSKLSDVELEEILAKKENGQSFREISKELNVEKKDIIIEIKKLKQAIEEKPS